VHTLGRIFKAQSARKANNLGEKALSYIMDSGDEYEEETVTYAVGRCE